MQEVHEQNTRFAFVIATANQPKQVTSFHVRSRFGCRSIFRASRRNRTFAPRTPAAPITASLTKPSPQSEPTAVEHQRVAVVEAAYAKPSSHDYSRSQEPNSRNNRCSHLKGSGVQGHEMVDAHKHCCPADTSAFVRSSAILWCHCRSAPMVAPRKERSYKICDEVMPSHDVTLN